MDTYVKEGEGVTWQLWQCLSAETLGKLVMFQWEKHGLVLDLMNQKQEPETFVENLEEIDHLIRQAPSRSRGDSG